MEQGGFSSQESRTSRPATCSEASISLQGPLAKLGNGLGRRGVGRGDRTLTPGSDWLGHPVLGSKEVGGEGAPTNPRGWSRPEHLWVVECRGSGRSRGVPVTSNHGKDKKRLHPFACWSTSGPLSGQIWVLWGAVTWTFEDGM